MTEGHDSYASRTGQAEHDSMDRTVPMGKLADKRAETDSQDSTGGTGQLERTVGTGQSGRTAMAGKIQQDDWKRYERTAGTGQPRQDNCVKKARKVQIGQDRDSWDSTTKCKRTARTGHLRKDSQDRSVWGG
jgi:hypothetical protein